MFKSSTLEQYTHICSLEEGDDTEANLQKLYVITSSVDPGKAETEEQQDHYRKCRYQLEGLLFVNGDNVSDILPLDVQTLQSAIPKIPDWEDAYVFYHDHQRFNNPKANVLCQRHQLSGLCYIHGPCSCVATLFGTVGHGFQSRYDCTLMILTHWIVYYSIHI